MKEHMFGVETFIGGYYIDTDLCDKIKLYFDNNIKYASYILHQERFEEND